MKFGFIITHIGSGGTLLCRILNTNYQVNCLGKTNLVYDHPFVLETLQEKIDNALGKPLRDNNDWYIDKLLNNYNFSCTSLYKTCKFIYMVRSPQVPLSALINRGCLAKYAESYYLFRLRRMCEMAVHTSGVLLTYEDLVTKRAFPLLENFLKLKSPLSDEFVPLNFDDQNLINGRILKDPVESNAKIPDHVLKSCEKGYQRYFKFMETQTGLIRFAI